MTGDAQVLARIDAAFDGVERPEHFTDFGHCCECAEHDDLLRSRDRETLAFEDVGNPGWDPLCFASAQGIAYYFPALARLALAPPVEGRGWYATQLLFHLLYESGDNRIYRYCDPAQRAAVAALLEHLAESRSSEVGAHGVEDELAACRELWSGR